MAQQRVSAARRVSNSKLRDRILIQPAILQIRSRRFPFQRAFELLDEKSLCFAMHFHED